MIATAANSSEQIRRQRFRFAAPQAPLTPDLFGKTLAVALAGELRDATSAGQVPRRQHSRRHSLVRDPLPALGVFGGRGKMQLDSEPGRVVEHIDAGTVQAGHGGEE